MRWLVIASLAACGGLSPAACGGAAPPAAPPGPPGPAAPRTRVDDPPAVDPIAALAPGLPDEQVSWLIPGRAQLELGGNAIEAPGGDAPIEIGVIDRQGDLVRAAVRLEHARFSVWTERAHLLPILKADHRAGAIGAMGARRDVHAVLRAGARVQRLARKGDSTHVRYLGAVEVEAWVPSELLVEGGGRRAPLVRRPSGRRPVHVMPGAVIREEARWTARALATVAGGYVLELVKEVEPPWALVAYEDSDVSVHGYLSKHAPPGRVHRPRGPEVPLPAVTPNGKVRGGTCLYARTRGDAIGYIVGDREVELDDAGGGWWSLAIDTPWGPIAFAARGPARGELLACAPPVTAP